MLAFIGSQGYAPAAGLKTVSSRAAAPAMYSSKSDLEALAKELNPVIGFWDPLKLADQEFWGESNEATIGFLRHAEIKHGRVAMAGFVGYCVHANGIYFPWDIQKTLDYGPGWPYTKDLPTVSFGDISAAGSPGDMWDALPTAAKVQIICVVGFLEMWSETSSALELDGQKHYVRGGKPGYFPSCATARRPNARPPRDRRCERHAQPWGRVHVRRAPQ